MDFFKGLITGLVIGGLLLIWQRHKNKIKAAASTVAEAAEDLKEKLH